MMGKKILSISIIIAVAALAGASSAQELLPDRDPFFSTRPGSAATTTSSRGDTWGRDPFTRPFEGQTAVPQVPGAGAQGKNLTGIIYGAGVRLAIIGGEGRREGSMIGDQKLVDIRRRSVVLMSSAGGLEEVFLENFSIRK